jgi:BirA family transcriptional regulator, biotin operon repressor / biotin---[acetyl-CoA-carboxylase] ligase
LNNEQKLLSILHRVGSESLLPNDLAKEMGVSLVEVAQTASELRLLGFGIENHPQRGYRLVSTPDSLIPEDLQARMSAIEALPSGNYVGNKILTYEQTASTNDLVNRLALEDYPEGLTVFAESQTAGRGRLGRKWISPDRKGLWFSVLFRPRVSTQWASQLTVMTSVAVATSLRRTTGLPLRIKWPNDILCGGRKVVGILVELNSDLGEIRHVVVGIGIDVNLERADFPKELEGIATSLKLEAGNSFQRPALAADLLLELQRCSELLKNGRFSELLERWLELDDTLGKQVSVFSNNGLNKIQGLAANLDVDGALLLRLDNGHLERVMAGEVTIHR